VLYDSTMCSLNILDCFMSVVLIFTFNFYIGFCNFSNYIFILELIFHLHYVGMANLELIDPVIDAKPI
jgi:hypothetical protein